MKDLTTYIQTELYPALFENINIVFSDMQFTWNSRGNQWESPLKMNGEPAREPKKNKTQIRKRNFNKVFEQGRGSLDLLSFYMERSGEKDLFKAVKHLAEILGITPPQEGNSEQYKAYRERQTSIEAAAERMREALFSPEGAEALEYLEKVRGYNRDFINFANLGYCSTAEAVRLKAIFTSSTTGAELCPFPVGIESGKYISIPYTTGGNIAGFVFRSIAAPGEQPKYLDAFISKSATKKYHLFGLTGLNLKGEGERDRDITVVEGELDALRASLYIDNVVAAAGGVLSAEALEEAKKRGVRRITVLLDTEDTEEGQQATERKKEEAVRAIYRAGLYPLIAEFPRTAENEKTDTDTYLATHTGAELEKVIQTARAGILYLLDRTILRITDVKGFKESDIVPDRYIHQIKEAAIELINLKNVTETDKSLICKELENRTEGAINKEALKAEAERLREVAAREEQRERIKALTAEAYNLASGTDPRGAENALRLLGDKIEPLRRISREEQFNRLLQLPTEEDIKRRFSDRPAGIDTNFYFGYGEQRERLLLQAGALTYICAPTSHGKSRMLENLALQLATDGAEGDILYFSFEEDKTAVEMQLLNIYINKPLSKNNIRSIAAYYKTGSNYFRGDNIETFREKEKSFKDILKTGKLRVISEDYDSTDLIAAIKYLNSQIKVRAVFIDYIQLLHTRGCNKGRKEELADMCRGFMATAKETGLPVILAAQLNREALSPLEMTAQNIAEASEIEHSANTIILLWNSVNKPLNKSSYYIRNGVKRELSEEAKKLESKGFKIGRAGTMYAVLAKNRAGARNLESVLSFNGNTGAIEPGGEPQEQPAGGNSLFNIVSK